MIGWTDVVHVQQLRPLSTIDEGRVPFAPLVCRPSSDDADGSRVPVMMVARRIAGVSAADGLRILRSANAATKRNSATRATFFFFNTLFLRPLCTAFEMDDDGMIY